MTDEWLHSLGRLESGCLAQGPKAPEQFMEQRPMAPETFDGKRVVDFAAGVGRCPAVTAQ